jgi:hypothetical protein
LGNMMYKNVAAPGKPKVYRMYIIDFGMSTAMIDGNFINKKTKTFHYKKKNHYNPSHDLRMTLTSMFSEGYRARKRLGQTLGNAITISLCSILRYYCIDRKPLFWDTYNDLIHIRDDTFLPDTVLKWCNYLIENNRASKYNNKNEMDTIKSTRILKQSIFDKLCDIIVNKPVYKIKSNTNEEKKPYVFKKKFGRTPFFSGCILSKEIEYYYSDKQGHLLPRFNEIKDKVYKHMSK